MLKIELEILFSFSNNNVYTCRYNSVSLLSITIAVGLSEKIWAVVSNQHSLAIA